MSILKATKKAEKACKSYKKANSLFFKELDKVTAIELKIAKLQKELDFQVEKYKTAEIMASVKETDAKLAIFDARNLFDNDNKELMANGSEHLRAAWDKFLEEKEINLDY